MRRPTVRLTLLVVLAAGGATPCAHAQADAAFDTLAVVVAGVLPLGRTVLHEAWAPPRGLEVVLESPFYAGTAGAGIQVLPRPARQAAVPDLFDRYLFVAWHAGLRLPGALRAQAGFRLGILQVHADGPDVPPTLRSEQEVRADLVAGIQAPLARHWSARLRITHGTVFFSEPVRQTFVTLGVGRAFGTPRWLQEVLR
jgi:hypothetical protein